MLVTWGLPVLGLGVAVLEEVVSVGAGGGAELEGVGEVKGEVVEGEGESEVPGGVEGGGVDKVGAGEVY